MSQNNQDIKPSPDSFKSDCRGRRKRCPAWRLCIRLVGACIILPALLLLGWLNLFGIPEFLYDRVTGLVNQEGMDFSYRKIHFSIIDGIHILEGKLTSQAQSGEIGLNFDRARIQYEIDDGHIRPKGLEILDGSLVVSAFQDNLMVSGTNTTSLLQNIHAVIEFDEKQTTRIEKFKGDFNFGTLKFSGTLTNAWSALGKRNKSPKNTNTTLRISRLISDVDRIQEFIRNASPEIEIRLDGDVAQPTSLEVDIRAKTDRIKTSDFELSECSIWMVNGENMPHNNSDPENKPSLYISIDVDEVLMTGTNPYPGKTDLFSMESHLWLDPESGLPRRIVGHSSSSEVRIGGDENPRVTLQSPGLYFRASRNQADPDSHSESAIDWGDLISSDWEFETDLKMSEADWHERQLEFSDPTISVLWAPLDSEGQNHNISIHAGWASMKKDELSFGSTAFRLPPVDWKQLSQWYDSEFKRTGTMAANPFSTDDLDAWLDIFKNFSLSSNSIQFKDHPIGDVEISIYEGGENNSHTTINLTDPNSHIINADLTLDRQTHTISVTGSSGVNIKQWAALLPEETVEVLGRVEWDEAPQTTFNLGPAQLPGILNSQNMAEWFSGAARLRGLISMNSGNFRGIPFSSLESDYSFVNDWWYLKEIVIQRDEGEMILEFKQNNTSGVYTVDIKGTVSIQTLRPLFAENADFYFEKVHESGPFVGDVTVSGPWDEGLGAITGTVHHTGLTWINRKLDLAKTSMTYIDRTSRLTLSDSEIKSGDGQFVKMSFLTLDWPQRNLTLLDVEAQCRPSFIASLLSEDSSEDIDQYDFKEPGNWMGGGEIYIGEDVRPNLQFRLKHPNLIIADSIPVEELTTEISWAGKQLKFSDTAGRVFGGRLAGELALDFTPTDNSEDSPGISMDISAENVSMNTLAARWDNNSDIGGIADLRLNIQSGRTGSLETWIGAGDLTIRDGNIWTIPVFGALSKILDELIPGIGHSIIKRGYAEFSLQGGQLEFSQCQLTGTQFGLEIDGGITTTGNIKGSARAKLFQAQNAVEKILNITFSPLAESLRFELGGSVEKPTVKPLYMIPRVLLNPLSPKEWFRSRGKNQQAP